jgi:hypothetical protein
MDDIIKLKAEIYDLMAQVQQLQQLMSAKNNQLIELMNKQKDVEPNNHKK